MRQQEEEDHLLCNRSEDGGRVSSTAVDTKNCQKDYAGCLMRLYGWASVVSRDSLPALTDSAEATCGVSTGRE